MPEKETGPPEGFAMVEPVISKLQTDVKLICCTEVHELAEWSWSLPSLPTPFLES